MYKSSSPNSFPLSVSSVNFVNNQNFPVLLLSSLKHPLEVSNRDVRCHERVSDVELSLCMPWRRVGSVHVGIAMLICFRGQEPFVFIEQRAGQAPYQVWPSWKREKSLVPAVNRITPPGSSSP